MTRSNLFHFLKHDVVIAVALTLISAVPRLIFLDQLPSGIHGDEGWTGIDAEVISAGNWLPLYSGNALGQPTGPLYLTALLFKLFGNSIFILRLSMALFGIITVPLFYFLLRHFFPKRISFLTSMIFAFSLIHLHYSRIAFMLVSAPVFEITSLLMLFKGQKTGKLIYYTLAGFFIGIGLYSYNAFLVMPVLFTALLLCQTIIERNRTSLKGFLIFSLTALLISLPLLSIMVTEPGFYFAHHKQASIFLQHDFKNQKDIFNQSIFLMNNGFANLKQFFLGRFFDGSDGFGGFYNFNATYIVFILFGGLVALIEKKRDYFFILALLLFYMATSIFFTGSVYRRLFLTIPLFYFLVAVFLNRVLMVRRHVTVSIILCTATLVLIISESVVNTQTYFTAIQTERVHSTFASSLTRSFDRLNSFRSKDDVILLYSSRWPCAYETIRFLAPSVYCVDRSKEYGEHIFTLPHTSQTTHFVLIEAYQDSLDILKEMYPEGTVIEVQDGGKRIATIVTVTKTF